MAKNELIESLRTARERGERPVAERYANLGYANLGYADLRDANLGYADLGYADLRGANLRDADLRGADLRDANGGILQVTGLHPYQAVMVPTVQGWWLRIGCWQGTTQGLRDLVAKDDGWPEAHGEQITARRPLLNILADMCDLHAANHKDDLNAVMERWGTEKENAS